jgi:hypothetical protein
VLKCCFWVVLFGLCSIELRGGDGNLSKQTEPKKELENIELFFEDDFCTMAL